MKKLTLLLVVFLLIAAVGCTKTNEPASSTDPAPSSNNVASTEQSEAAPTEEPLGVMEPLEIKVEGTALTKQSIAMGEGIYGFPVEAIATQLGFDTLSDDQKVVVDTGQKIEITDGTITIDGEELTVEFAPIIFEGEAYVASHELAPLLGFEYLIEGNTATITPKPQN